MPNEHDKRNVHEQHESQDFIGSSQEEERELYTGPRRSLA
jgi:hypothetical protein